MSGRRRLWVLVLGATVLSSGVAAFEAQRSGPRPAPDPSLGDGGVSAFYVWDQDVPGTPGKLLRQEPVPDHLVLANAAKALRLLYTATNGIDRKTTVAVFGAILLDPAVIADVLAAGVTTAPILSSRRRVRQRQ